MGNCKLCEKRLPKSRLSSEYCLPCEDKIDEWVRISKLVKGQTVREKVDEQKEQVIKQAHENFQEVLKTGETLVKEIGSIGERFFQDLNKQMFGKKSNKKEE